MTTPPHKPVLHAYVSPEAEEALARVAEITGASKTGLVQAWLEDVYALMEIHGWDEAGAEKALGMVFVRAARKIDAHKRRRVKSS